MGAALAEMQQRKASEQAKCDVQMNSRLGEIKVGGPLRGDAVALRGVGTRAQGGGGVAAGGGAGRARRAAGQERHAWRGGDRAARRAGSEP